MEMICSINTNSLESHSHA